MKKLSLATFISSLLATNGFCQVNYAGTFTGNGSGLTNLAADAGLSGDAAAQATNIANSAVYAVKPWETNAVLAGCDNSGVTDCTAVIQSLIDTTPVGRTRTIYFPAGLYLCNRAPTNIPNSILSLPYYSGLAQRTTIKFEGPPGNNDVGSLSRGSSPTNGAILITTQTNYFAFFAANIATNSAALTSVFPIIDYITFRSPTNSVGNGLWLKNFQQLDIPCVSVDRPVATQSIVTAPPANTYGIMLPSVGAGDYQHVGAANIVGYDTGIGYTEHADISFLNIAACWTAERIGTDNSQGHMDNVVGHAIEMECNVHLSYSIWPGGNINWNGCQIGMLDIEDTSAGSPPPWFSRPSILVRDPGNALRVTAKVFVMEGTYPTNNLTRNGGSNCFFTFVSP